MQDQLLQAVVEACRVQQRTTGVILPEHTCTNLQGAGSGHLGYTSAEGIKECPTHPHHAVAFALLLSVLLASQHVAPESPVKTVAVEEEQVILSYHLPCRFYAVRKQEVKPHGRK